MRFKRKFFQCMHKSFGRRKGDVATWLVVSAGAILCTVYMWLYMCEHDARPVNVVMITIFWKHRTLANIWREASSDSARLCANNNVTLRIAVHYVLQLHAPHIVLRAICESEYAILECMDCCCVLPRHFSSRVKWAEEKWDMEKKERTTSKTAPSCMLHAFRPSRR